MGSQAKYTKQDEYSIKDIPRQRNKKEQWGVFLSPGAKNIIIQDDGQGQEKETEGQIMKDINTGAAEEAKSRPRTELKRL